MNKYCEKCGCYLPIGEEKCPACGYSEPRTFDNASNSFVWKPEDYINVANKPEVVKARFKSEVTVYGKLHQCPYGWGCMVPACAKCKYCDVNASPTLADGETRYTFYCREMTGRTWAFISSKDPRYDDEIPCPKFHMDNDCVNCDKVKCEFIEENNKDRQYYKNFIHVYTCPHMEKENMIKKVIYKCV